jgi:hypothetical protein
MSPDRRSVRVDTPANCFPSLVFANEE